MSDVPKSPVTRAAKMARLPIGLAGRTAIGLGKRIGGRSAELVAQEIQQRTAEQIFRVLGELKGGAMKLGQALSIFEAALPPEIAGPYRATLTKLQESAPPLPARTVHQVLTRELGEDWRDFFAEFSDTPAAAASIGQVHEAVWHDGRRVAVKVQYPGAGRALLGDFTQLSRAGRLFGLLMPGLDVKPLLEELKDRISEELDYELEAMSQQMFADAYAGDPDIYVPSVVMATGQVLVSDWMDGTPLSRIISQGSKEQRDRAGILLVRFLFSGPSRAGLLHADPHPGNFRLLDDGRLGVLDFGAVDRLPGGLPPFFGRLLRIMHDDDADIEEGRARAARARVPAGRDPRGPGRAARLPGTARRAVQGGFVQVHPGVAARGGQPGHRHADHQHQPPVQRAAFLRPHPPGVHGGRRRAVPARMRGRVPRRGAQVDTRLLRPGPGATWRPGGQPVIAFGAAIMARDMTAIAGLLHPDATFTSPAVFRPYQGRAAVLRVLTAATQTIEDFAYTGEAHGPGMDVLRFRGRVGQYQLEGVDIVSTGEDGLITDVTVMVRPLRGLEALVGGMQQALARLAEG